MSHLLKWRDLYWLLIASAILWYVASEIQEGLLPIHDPIAWLYQVSGWSSIIALVTGFLLPYPYSKYMGYGSFVSCLLHSMVFVYFDFDFLWEAIMDEIIHKHYLYYGFMSWMILCLTMLLSIKKLFWKLKLIWILYIAVFLAEIHIIMIQKVLTPPYIFTLTFIALITFAHFRSLIKKNNG